MNSFPKKMLFKSFSNDFLFIECLALVFSFCWSFDKIFGVLFYIAFIEAFIHPNCLARIFIIYSLNGTPLSIMLHHYYYLFGCVWFDFRLGHILSIQIVGPDISRTINEIPQTQTIRTDS